MRFLESVQCESALTILKVRDAFRDVTIGVERLWAADATGRVPARVRDDLSVNKGPGGDSLV